MILKPTKRVHILVLLAAFAPVSSLAKEATIHKFVGLEVGIGTFSFEQKIDQDIVYPVANLTAGLAYKRYNAVLNVSGSMSDADVSEEGEIGFASRKDLDLTFAYQINKVFSAFAGYKRGQTDLSLTTREPIVALGRQYFKQTGPFVGVNVNWAIPDAGKLAFSIAYADLDANNRFAADGDRVEPGETIEFDDINDVTRGSSQGFSYSLSWTMPIKGSLIFRTKIKVNSYDQDIQFMGQSFNKIHEQSEMLTAGVTHIF
jgi:hypothetical protein